LKLPFGGFPKNPKHVASNKPGKKGFMSDGLYVFFVVLVVAGMSKCKPEFVPGLVHLEFVLGEVTL